MILKGYHEEGKRRWHLNIEAVTILKAQMHLPSTYTLNTLWLFYDKKPVYANLFVAYH